MTGSAMDDDRLLANAEATARMVGLTIPADCRAGVLANLRILQEHAALVMGFPLDPDIQIASVFRP